MVARKNGRGKTETALSVRGLSGGPPRGETAARQGLPPNIKSATLIMEFTNRGGLAVRVRQGPCYCGGKPAPRQRDFLLFTKEEEGVTLLLAPLYTFSPSSAFGPFVYSSSFI